MRSGPAFGCPEARAHRDHGAQDHLVTTILRGSPTRSYSGARCYAPSLCRLAMSALFIHLNELSASTMVSSEILDLQFCCSEAGGHFQAGAARAPEFGFCKKLSAGLDSFVQCAFFSANYRPGPSHRSAPKVPPGFTFAPRTTSVSVLSLSLGRS